MWNEQHRETTLINLPQKQPQQVGLLFKHFQKELSNSFLPDGGVSGFDNYSNPQDFPLSNKFI